MQGGGKIVIVAISVSECAVGLYKICSTKKNLKVAIPEI